MEKIEDKTIEAISSMIDFFGDNKMVMEAKEHYALNLEDVTVEAKSIYIDKEFTDAILVLNRLLEFNYLLSIFDMSEVEVLNSDINNELIVSLFAISKIEERNESVFNTIEEYRSTSERITSLEFNEIFDDLHTMINKVFEEDIQPKTIGYCKFIESLLTINYEYFIFLFVAAIAQSEKIDVRDFACSLLTYINVNFDFEEEMDKIGESVFHTTILHLASSVENIDNKTLYEYYRTNLDIALIVNAIYILQTKGNSVNFDQIRNQINYIDHSTIWNK